MFYYVAKIGWFLLTPSNLLMLLAGLGLLAGAFLGRRRGFWLRISAASLIGLFVLGLSPLANALIAPLENRFPEWNGEPPDGIVVLGGAISTLVSGHRNVITLNESAERMTSLIALAVRYPHAKIVFSGGSSGFFKHDTTEAAIAKMLFAEAGLDPGRLLLEDRSLNTYQNATLSRVVASPKPGERWLLVTSAFHMPRAVGTFRSAGFPVEAYPVDYRTNEAGASGFVSIADGLKRADTAAKEWLGLAVYRATGRTESLFPAP